MNDGLEVAGELLRTLDRIEYYRAFPGGAIWRDMPEMSAVGSSEVIAIEPCLEIQPAPDRIVTGTFQHAAGGGERFIIARLRASFILGEFPGISNAGGVVWRVVDGRMGSGIGRA